MPFNKLGNETPSGGKDIDMLDTESVNSTGLPLYHLRRIGPPASKPGVADVMDFSKITYMIGRNANLVDFMIDSSDYVQSACISRCHARVVRQAGNQHRLHDDSLNGIFVNNIKIAGSCILREGDLVTFGHPCGMKLPAGVRKRQPNSEHQFLFEKCCCPHGSQDNREARQQNVSESTTTSSGFKSPEAAITTRQENVSNNRKRSRITTQSFTSEDVRKLRDTWNNVVETQNQKGSQESQKLDKMNRNEGIPTSTVDDKAIDTTDTVVSTGDEGLPLGNTHEVVTDDQCSATTASVSGDNLARSLQVGDAHEEHGVEGPVKQIIVSLPKQSHVSPSKHASVQTIAVPPLSLTVSPSKDVGIQTSQFTSTTASSNIIPETTNNTRATSLFISTPASSNITPETTNNTRATSQFTSTPASSNITPETTDNTRATSLFTSSPASSNITPETTDNTRATSQFTSTPASSNIIPETTNNTSATSLFISTPASSNVTPETTNNTRATSQFTSTPASSNIIPETTNNTSATSLFISTQPSSNVTPETTNNTRATSQFTSTPASSNVIPEITNNTSADCQKLVQLDSEEDLDVANMLTETSESVTPDDRLNSATAGNQDETSQMTSSLASVSVLTDNRSADQCNTAEPNNASDTEKEGITKVKSGTADEDVEVLKSDGSGIQTLITASNMESSDTGVNIDSIPNSETDKVTELDGDSNDEAESSESRSMTVNKAMDVLQTSGSVNETNSSPQDLPGQFEMDAEKSELDDEESASSEHDAAPVMILDRELPEEKTDTGVECHIQLRIKDVFKETDTVDSESEDTINAGVGADCKACASDKDKVIEEIEDSGDDEVEGSAGTPYLIATDSVSYSYEVESENDCLLSGDETVKDVETGDENGASVDEVECSTGNSYLIATDSVSYSYEVESENDCLLSGYETVKDLETGDENGASVDEVECSTGNSYLIATDSVSYSYEVESENNCLLSEDETVKDVETGDENGASVDGRSTVSNLTGDQCPDDLESDHDDVIKGHGSTDPLENIEDDNPDKNEMTAVEEESHSDEENENSSDNGSEVFGDPFDSVCTPVKRRREDIDSDNEDEEIGPCAKRVPSEASWYSLKSMEWIADPAADYATRTSHLMAESVKDFFANYRNSDSMIDCVSPEKKRLVSQNVFNDESDIVDNKKEELHGNGQEIEFAKRSKDRFGNAEELEQNEIVDHLAEDLTVTGLQDTVGNAEENEPTHRQKVNTDGSLDGTEQAKDENDTVGSMEEIEPDKAQNDTVGSMEEIEPDKAQNDTVGSMEEIEPDKAQNDTVGSMEEIEPDQAQNDTVGSMEEIEPDKVQNDTVGSMEEIGPDKAQNDTVGSMEEIEPDKAQNDTVGSMEEIVPDKAQNDTVGSMEEIEPDKAQNDTIGGMEEIEPDHAQNNNVGSMEDIGPGTDQSESLVKSNEDNNEYEVEDMNVSNDRVEASVCYSDDDVDNDGPLRDNWLRFSAITPTKTSTQEAKQMSPIVKNQNKPIVFSRSLSRCQTNSSDQVDQLSCQFSDGESDSSFPLINLDQLEEADDNVDETIRNEATADEKRNTDQEVVEATDEQFSVDDGSASNRITYNDERNRESVMKGMDSSRVSDISSEHDKRKCNFDNNESTKRSKYLPVDEDIIEVPSPPDISNPDSPSADCVVMETDRQASPAPGCSYWPGHSNAHRESEDQQDNNSFSCTQFLEGIDTASEISASQVSKVEDRLKEETRGGNTPKITSESRNKMRALLERMKNKNKLKEENMDKKEPVVAMATMHERDSESVESGLQFDENTPEIERHVKSCKRVIEELKDLFQGSPTLTNNPRIQAWSDDLKELETKIAFPKTTIAVVGDTGAGKSSLMNAILDHRSVLPTSGIRACTAVVVEVVQNNKNNKFEADIEFLQRKEWFDELQVLLQDLTSFDGTIRKHQPDPTSEVHVSYLKIKAVYGRIDKFEILSRMNTVTHWLGRVKVVSSNNPEEFRRKVEKYIETQDPGTGGQYWPIVKHVRLRMPNCDVCSSGAALVDLPGVRDSNAARDKIAREHLKNCTAVWVVSSIHRAIDDKTAKDLLGETFRRQLLMDGQYGSIAFICTKTDVLMPSEIIRSLALEHKTKQHEDQVIQKEQQKADLDLEISECELHIGKLSSEIENINTEMTDLQTALTELEGIMDPDSQETDEQKMVKEFTSAVEGMKQQNVDNKKQIEDYRAKQSQCKQKMMELDQDLAVERRAIAAVCARARNEYSKHEIRRDFRAGLREMKRRAGMTNDEEDEEEVEDLYDDNEDDDDDDIGSSARSLKVFCCSSTEYQKMKNLLTDDGPPQVFNNLEDTQIPDLRCYVHEMTRIRRQQALERLIRGLGQFVFDIRSYTADGNIKGHSNRQGAKSLIDSHLVKFNMTIGLIMEGLSRDIDIVFDGSLRQKLDQGAIIGQGEAPDICSKWGLPMIRDKNQDRRAGGLAWGTYRATSRRQGVFKSPTFGLIDFNEELSEPMLRGLTIVWDKAFSGMLWRILDKSKLKVMEELGSFTTILCNQLERCGVAKVRSSRVRTQLLGSAEHQLTEMLSSLKDQITSQQREISRQVTPQIQVSMLPTYTVCAEESGTGMFSRMKAHMTSGVDKKSKSMFNEASRNMMQSLVTLKDEIITMMKRSCDQLIQSLKVAFEPLWDATANSQELRAALMRPMEEVCRRVNQIYTDAGMRNEQIEELAQIQDTVGHSQSGLAGTTNPGTSLASEISIPTTHLQSLHPALTTVKIETPSGHMLCKVEKFDANTYNMEASGIKQALKQELLDNSVAQASYDLGTTNTWGEAEMNISPAEVVVETSAQISNSYMDYGEPSISEVKNRLATKINQNYLSAGQQKQTPGRIITMIDKQSSVFGNSGLVGQSGGGLIGQSRVNLPSVPIATVTTPRLSQSCKPAGCAMKLSPDGRFYFLPHERSNTATSTLMSMHTSTAPSTTLTHVPTVCQPVQVSLLSDTKYAWSQMATNLKKSNRTSATQSVHSQHHTGNKCQSPYISHVHISAASIVPGATSGQNVGPSAVASTVQGQFNTSPGKENTGLAMGSAGQGQLSLSRNIANVTANQKPAAPITTIKKEPADTGLYGRRQRKKFLGRIDLTLDDSD